jgi:hypothetical protein
MKNSRKSNQDYYCVEEIVDKKEENDIIKYKVKRKGFPLSEATWETRDNLASAQELIDQYEEKKKPLLGKKRKREETDYVKNHKKMSKKYILPNLGFVMRMKKAHLKRTSQSKSSQSTEVKMD